MPTLYLPSSQVLKMDEFNNELNYWKSQCKLVQSNLDEHIKKAKEEKKKGTEENTVEVEYLTKLKEVIIRSQEGMELLEKKYGNWLVNLSDRFFESDQYSKKGNLLIHGYKYLPNIHGADFILFAANEINNLFPSLRGRVTPFHIDDAHPLKTKKNRGKVIIIKFTNRWIKNEILKCKEDLNGSSFMVTEHLTAHTQELLSAANNLVGKENVSVTNTIVSAKFDGHKYTLRNYTDLNQLDIDVKNKCNKPVSAPTPVNTSSDINLIDLTSNNINSQSEPTTVINTTQQTHTMLQDINNNNAIISTNSVPVIKHSNYDHFLKRDIIPPVKLRIPSPRGRASRYGRGGFNHGDGRNIHRKSRNGYGQDRLLYYSNYY